MATSPIPPNASPPPKTKTEVIVVLLVVVIFFVVLASWATRRFASSLASQRRPSGSRREQSERRGVIHEELMLKPNGIGLALVELIPVFRFGDRSSIGRRTRTLDLERCPTISASRPAQMDFPRPVRPGQTRQERPACPAVTRCAEKDWGRSGGYLDQREYKLRGWRNSHSTTQRDDQVNCAICTEVFRDTDEVRVLGCGHIYHLPCIDPWLSEFARTCPVWYVPLHQPHLFEKGDLLMSVVSVQSDGFAGNNYNLIAIRISRTTASCNSS